MGMIKGTICIAFSFEGTMIFFLFEILGLLSFLLLHDCDGFFHLLWVIAVDLLLGEEKLLIRGTYDVGIFCINVVGLLSTVHVNYEIKIVILYKFLILNHNSSISLKTLF